MGSIPVAMLVHQATVEPLLGRNATSPVYGPPVTIRCLVEDVAKLVRRPDGREVVASVDVFCVPGTVVGPVDSRWTVNGRVMTAAVVRDRDGGGLATPDHIHVSLE